MTITLLDLYNKVASQPWSMFDNDAQTSEDFEPALISAINKALTELWCSYPFEFRLKQKKILAQRYVNKYNLPDGAIYQKNTSGGEKYCVNLGRKYLEFIEDPETLEFEIGKPQGFFIKNNSLCFYPTPDDSYEITVTYLTFSVGVDAEDKPIYALRDATDRIIVPQKYEQLFLNALITKAMMYVIASPSDENYAGYMLQHDKAYKLLVKAVGGRKKHRKMTF